VEDIDFLSGFCCWKLKQIAPKKKKKKNWVWKEKKKSVQPSMCSHLGQQTAQTTLVFIKFGLG
jgi:hypothetical protein